MPKQDAQAQARLAFLASPVSAPPPSGRTGTGTVKGLGGGGATLTDRTLGWETMCQGGQYKIVRKRTRLTHLLTYSLNWFAIRTICGSCRRFQFSRKRFSYSCRSQCGMYTIVGVDSVYLPPCDTRTRVTVAVNRDRGLALLSVQDAAQGRARG